MRLIMASGRKKKKWDPVTKTMQHFEWTNKRAEQTLSFVGMTRQWISAEEMDGKKTTAKMEPFVQTVLWSSHLRIEVNYKSAQKWNIIELDNMRAWKTSFYLCVCFTMSYELLRIKSKLHIFYWISRKYFKNKHFFVDCRLVPLFGKFRTWK